MGEASAEGDRVAGAAPAVAVALAVVAIWAVWTAQGMAAGAPVLNDEFLSLARAQGFLAPDGTWLSVRQNHTPSLLKPPLQYWITALLIDAGAAPMLALRAPAWAYAVGILLVTLVLARSVRPRQPWCAPAALLLLVSSPMVAWVARIGVLDAGMVFFQLVAIAALLRARSDPRWWLVAGVAVALEFLQKAPVALLACSFLLVVLGAGLRVPAYGASALARERAFRIGVTIAIVGCLAWPVLQVAQHGTLYLESFFGKQMWERFAPGPAVGGEAMIDPGRWLGWLLFDLPRLPSDVAPWSGLRLSLIWVVALAALAAAVFGPRARRDPPVFALGCWLLVVLAAFSVAGGSLHPQYILVVLPILAVLAAAGLTRLIRRPGLVLAICALLLASRVPLLVSVPERSRGVPGPWPEIAARFRAGLRPHETPVYIAPMDDPRFTRPAFLVYADLDRPAIAMRGLRWRIFQNRAAKLGVEPPYFGLVRADGMEFVREHLGPVVEVERVGEFVLWRQVASPDAAASGGDD